MRLNTVVFNRIIQSQKAPQRFYLEEGVSIFLPVLS